MTLTTSLVPVNKTALQERQTGVLTYETEDRLTEAFADFLSIDVANGDARPDTVRVYKAQVKMWWQWCRENGIRPGEVIRKDVELYRKHLVERGLKHSTISLKLTTVRRFYEAAMRQGLIGYNPAEKVNPPRDRSASGEILKCLSWGEAERLFMEIPGDGSLKSLRDRAMVALMLLEGLRTVEIVRANVEDIEESSEGIRILVHGKGRDGLIYPRNDTTNVIWNYLKVRGNADLSEHGETTGTPLFTSVGNFASGRRITRDGVRFVVNSYLGKAGLKRPGLSSHGLRHTCGSLLYKETKDLRVVQETLRHSTPAMAARYSHIESRNENRYTRKIPVKMNV